MAEHSPAPTTTTLYSSLSVAVLAHLDWDRMTEHIGTDTLRTTNIVIDFSGLRVSKKIATDNFILGKANDTKASKRRYLKRRGIEHWALDSPCRREPSRFRESDSEVLVSLHDAGWYLKAATGQISRCRCKLLFLGAR
jgi:hypothetical protein